MRRPGTQRRTGERRRTRLGSRLLATLMVPILALTALGAFDARKSGAEAGAAAAVERQVLEVERDLAVCLGLSAEKVATEALVMAAEFGIPRDLASELLGMDLGAALAAARLGLDQAVVHSDAIGQRMAEVVAMRVEIDAGTAVGVDVEALYSEVIDLAEESWFGELRVLEDITFETEGSADVRRAATALLDAAGAFTHGSNQTSEAAKISIPGLSASATPREDLIVDTRLYDLAAADLADELTPVARAHWLERVRADADVLRFEAHLADMLASPPSAAPATLDLERLADVFASGLVREERMREVVELQVAGVVELARQLRTSASTERNHQTAALLALVAVSVAVTAATARSIVVPLRRLAGRATEVSGGQIDGDVLPLRGPLEVAQVTSAFNESVATLQLVAAEAAALASADFDHPSLRAPVPGLVGEAMRHSVERLSQSMRDNEELRRSLSRKATHDSLTELPNRALLLDRLEHALARSNRSTGSLGVVFIDLDHFKVVNDAKGHGTGDKLLVEVAQRIRSSVRAGDTVARFGGDEFVVILEGIDGAMDAALVCDGIRERLEVPFTVDGAALVVSASQGIAIAGHGDTAEDLLRTADAAMYAAKEHGRARTEIADDATRSRATRRLQVEADMRRGLDAGEFVVHFQPVVALADGAIAGAEALVRWHDPNHGIVMPDQFIPIAEETGLIVALGEHVLREALHEAARWPSIDGGAPPYVAVNVSGRQFLVPGFADVVSRAIVDAGIDPGRVHLELTESVLMRDVDRSASALDAIAAQGVHISIDDFGTGYSSLRYLQRLPIDTLKVDQSFVQLLEENGREAAIVTAVIDLARALGIDAIAEGVETAKQLRELQRLGCRYGQGFWFARPMPAADLAAMLARTPSEDLARV